VFRAFRDFGLSSINCLGYAAPLSGREKDTWVIGGSAASVVVRRDPEHPLVYSHDQGKSVFFEMTDDERALIGSRLAEAGRTTRAVVGPLSVAQATDI
jgi:hypothetical protein